MSKTMTRWNPLRELEDFQHRILSAFHPTSARLGNGQESTALAVWAPLADITEDDKEYVISVELPEVKKEDVKVTMQNGMLTIAGDRKFEKEETNKTYHRIERCYGSFARSFAMPDDSDAAKVNADFKDGMLTVRVAKNEAARPKQIEIKVN